MFCHCCTRLPSPCISHAFSLASRYSTLDFLGALPVKPNARFLVTARIYRYGRSPAHILYPELSCPHPHTTILTRRSPAFRAFHSSCFIYSSRSTVPSPFCYPHPGATMRGKRLLCSLALSLCTSFDIDVLSFAITPAVGRTRCNSPWLRNG